MLALGTTAQAVASCLVLGLPFLLPYLRRTEGLTLAQGGALVAAPSLGMVVTLIAWGAFADRYGERLAIALGLGLTGVLGLASAGGERPGRPGRAVRTLGGGRCLGELRQRPRVVARALGKGVAVPWLFGGMSGRGGSGGAPAPGLFGGALASGLTAPVVLGGVRRIAVSQR